MTIAQAHVKTKFCILEDQDDVRNLDNSDKAQAVYLLAAQLASVIHLPGPVSSASRRPRNPTYQRHPATSCPVRLIPAVHPPTNPTPTPTAHKSARGKKRKRKEENSPPCFAAVRSSTPHLRLIPPSPSSRRPLPLRASHRHPLPSRV